MNPLRALRGRGSALASRGLWVMADQALSSLSNAGLALVIATHVTPSEYGAFVLAFSIYGFTLWTAQAMSGQVLAVKFSKASVAGHASAGATAAGVSLASALLVSIILAISAVFVDDPLSSALIAFAVLLPALLLQDAWRGVFISRGTPAGAFINDAVWVCLQFIAIVVIIYFDRLTATWFIAAWGGAAAFAALYGVRQAGYWPKVTGLRAWLVNHKEVVLPSVASTFAGFGATQVAYISIAAIGSLTDVGALRGAQTLLGPVNIVSFAAGAFLIPEVARRGVTARGLTMVATGSSLALTLITVTWGSLFLLLPMSAGRYLLGDTWASARETLPFMLAFTCFIAAASGATNMVRAWNRGSYAFWISAILGPLILGFSAVGTYLDGGRGAAIGFALAAGIVLPVTWLLFARVAKMGPVTDPQDALNG